MDRDEILGIYDPWYADHYDQRFHGGDAWNDNLAAYKLEIVRELLQPGGRWLDVGCGTGKHLSAFPDVEREGLDLSPSMVDKALETNPGVPIHEGSYLDDHPDWVGRWDLVSNLWLSYQFVDSLKDLERAVSNMASWVSPTGSLFMHVADCEDVARGTVLPWEDAETPVFGDSLFVTSVTWTWKESNGRSHLDLVAPQLQRMVNIVARDFDEVEVRRWPAIDLVSGRPKGVVGRKKRSTSRTLAEVGTAYPYNLLYPPRDHPREHDASRPWDEAVDPPPSSPESSTSSFATSTRPAGIEAELAALRGEMCSVTDALRPPTDGERYDTLGVIHDQVWNLRKDVADFYQAWAASSPLRPLGQASTRSLGAELARRLNPFSRQFWRRLRRRLPRSPGSGSGHAA